MHRDVVNLILHYLSLPDLACCECVCKGWRDTIHWWVAAFGFHVHFPHIIWDLQRESNMAIWEAFKVQARQQHCIRSGKPSSMQEFSFRSYYDMTIVGNFVAGQSSTHEQTVSWHQLAVPGGAVVHTKEVALKKVWRVHVVLMYLEMNQEGLLLLRLGETGKHRARSAIYSPIDGKTVWRQDHRHNDPRYGVPGELTPLLIGRSVLHCARRGSNRDTFDLVGIDFRASNPTVIYESSVVGARNWAQNKSCRRLVLIGEQHELVVLSGNEQWVGTGTISILNGENGQLLFQFDGGPAHFHGRKLVAQPTINQFSIQTVPARVRLGDAVQPWEAHAEAVRDFIIMQTFSFAFSGSDSSSISILRLGTDVVLSPCSNHMIAIQPFAKVAVALQSDDNSILSDRILSYSLVEANETSLIQMAEAVLKASCPPNSAPPNLRHCFILQEPGPKSVSGHH
ncbi:uncharacterized protein P174DRAFT_454861 [Aspergillus novofumigatus IBT 16806]|uniref:F-box domain-containing protein n=1 Tax=Aspergillus novofumigatus (strain IBT 16806) TaxID=1392255 RepID=A0A2I1BWY0_ASPN1|nr:uncharacterized protein P174DRAFT_454861 [Aspergillus novofumigatus IBT 16806]PKX89893.1 hypothetical protein P174DRAFT_454861 [Aspergillus novofumigatus IBT 16806]